MGDATITWTLRDDSGNLVDSDSVRVTVAKILVTPFRPQSDGPGYGNPFPRTEVPVVSTGTSAGIRRNGDDDDNDSTADLGAGDTSISGEDDLIEVKLLIPTLDGIEYRLKRSNDNITVWSNSNKSGPIIALSDADDMAIVSASAGTTISAWAEWATMSPAQTASALTLELWTDTADPRTDDVGPIQSHSVMFYPFTSVVIVWGGSGQNPDDTDGDGSIGDPVSGSNREGIFDIAQRLYEEGWDVHAYDEESADEPDEDVYDDSVAFHEVENAVDNRGVTDVAIMGYSHGGGATQELAEALNTAQVNIDFAVYLDAVDHNGVNEENEFPAGVDYLLNIYQPNGIIELGGGHVSGAQEEYDTGNDTGWDHSLDHFSIDDDKAQANDPPGQRRVQEEIIETLSDQMDP